MADQDFNIKVITTADTSGIRQTEAELQRLSRLETFMKEKAAREAAALETERAKASKQKPPPVSEEFLPVDTSGLTRLTQGLTVVTALILNAVRTGIKEQSALNLELEKTTERVSKLTQTWSEQANVAQSQDDISKIVQRALPEIDALTSKIVGANKAAVSFSEGGVEAVASLLNVLSQFAGAGSPFDNKQFTAGVEQVNKFFRVLQQRQVEAAGDAVEMGRALEKSLNADKFRNTADVIAETTSSISEMKELMLGLNVHTAEGLKLWNDYRKQVEASEARLAALINLEKLHKKEIEDKEKAAKKSGETAASLEKKAAALQGQPGGEEAAQQAAAARAEAQRQEAELREQKRAEARKRSDFDEVRKYGRVLDPQERAQETIKEREELGQQAGQKQEEERQKAFEDQMQQQLRGITPEQQRNEREALGVKPTDQRDTSQGIIQAIEKLNEKFDRYWQ